jgi:hypothetical protein
VLFKFQNLNLKRPYLSASSIFIKNSFQNINCRFWLAISYFYTRPSNLLGHWLIASWHYSSAWAALLKWIPLLLVLVGAFGKYVYELPKIHKPDYCIAHWKAINIHLALCVFSSFVQGRQVTIWCDNNIAISILSFGRGTGPLLQCIACNLWLFQAHMDCHIVYEHIRGPDNRVADLLSIWLVTSNPVAQLLWPNLVAFWFLHNVSIQVFQCPQLSLALSSLSKNWVPSIYLKPVFTPQQYTLIMFLIFLSVFV